MSVLRNRLAKSLQANADTLNPKACENAVRAISSIFATHVRALQKHDQKRLDTYLANGGSESNYLEGRVQAFQDVLLSLR